MVRIFRFRIDTCIADYKSYTSRMGEKDVFYTMLGYYMNKLQVEKFLVCVR